MVGLAPLGSFVVWMRSHAAVVVVAVIVVAAALLEVVMAVVEGVTVAMAVAIVLW